MYAISSRTDGWTSSTTTSGMGAVLARVLSTWTRYLVPDVRARTTPRLIRRRTVSTEQPSAAAASGSGSHTPPFGVVSMAIALHSISAQQHRQLRCGRARDRLVSG